MFLTRVFFFLCYLLALLPMFVLYLFALLLFVVLDYVVRYRRKVVEENLKNAFPEKSPRERRHLRNRYYWHLSQIAVEMIKMLLLPRKTLHRRYRCVNPDAVNCFYKEGRSVILMSSHLNNWEWMILALDEMFDYHGVGVGKANTDKVFEKLINRARTRYGTEVVFAENVRETFEKNDAAHRPIAYMMLCDQSPNNRKKCYVTDFLNQRTGVIYGAEYFARKYDLPVFYYRVVKERIGQYHIEIQRIADSPKELPEYAITQRYVELLEQDIREQPACWLWSHRRWKFQFD